MGDVGDFVVDYINSDVRLFFLSYYSNVSEYSVGAGDDSYQLASHGRSKLLSLIGGQRQWPCPGVAWHF
jgi:hypothetical protein